MRRAAILLLLAACACAGGGGRGAPDLPVADSGSGSATPAPVAEAKVTDRASAEAAQGRRAAVTGTAGNAMLGAALVLSDRTPVYCLPLERWPDDVDRTTVTAHGTLAWTDEFAASAGGAGTAGAVLVLRDCTYDPPSR